MDELLKEKNIILIGFMGAGKTTIGKQAATMLNREFIDVDEKIEKEYKLPVSEIFHTYGEKAFREREKRLITSLCNQNKKVISLGGGSFLQKEIRNLCMSSGIVIFLEITFENWKSRIDLLMDTRPVLQGKTLEEMEDLFNRRQELYNHHHMKVLTDDKSAEEITNELIENLSLYWKNRNGKVGKK